MTREEFRQRLANRARPFVDCCIHSVGSVTDPSFYMTGAQLFAAAAQGLPIPTPPIIQEYNNVHADDITPCDTLYGDKFEKHQYAKEFLKETDNKVLTLKKELDNESKKN